MKVTTIQKQGESHRRETEYDDVDKAEIEFEGYTLTIIKVENSVTIDLEYHDGQNLRLEEVML